MSLKNKQTKKKILKRNVLLILWHLHVTKYFGFNFSLTHEAEKCLMMSERFPWFWSHIALILNFKAGLNFILSPPPFIQNHRVPFRKFLVILSIFLTGNHFLKR